ncbi:MAG TPA: peptide ABC transporter substrate-binding protein [Chloroflexota bacterium]|nr:peptide ABC transporter substrate-binding protein [Chloroflexota bacterium]
MFGFVRARRAMAAQRGGRSLARSSFVVAAALCVFACASPQPSGAPRNAGPSAASTGSPSSRVLRIGIQREPPTVALRPFQETFASQYVATRTFNADISIVDDNAQPHPYLVDALPQLNTDSWQVFPDGRMDTTYHLRPNLTWHDGTHLTAEDFVFGWKVYTAPNMAQSHGPPYAAIADVTAPDDRTFVIHWSTPYPDAGHLSGRDQQFPALPRHLLQREFESDATDAFFALSYWTRDYVGLGPYKMINWEPGAYIEASAFAGHSGGPPKVSKVRITFIGDRNTALANALGGDVDILADNVIQFGDALTLRREWEPRQGGTVVWTFGTWRGIDIQHRPTFVRPQALLDLQVRKALIQAVDRQGINDAIYEGVALMADYVVPPLGQFGDAAKNGSVKYPFDPRQSEQLMNAAGYVKGPDGFFTSPAGGRFTVEMKTSSGPDNEQELAAIADAWRNTGFDITQAVVPVAQTQNLEVRAGYSGMYLLSTPGGDRTAASYTADNVPLPENNWRGSNRSGWSNDEYTQLAKQFQSTLDVRERLQQLTQMARIFTEDVASISLYFRPQVWAFTSDVRGGGTAPPETDPAWNMPDWEIR